MWWRRRREWLGDWEAHVATVLPQWDLLEDHERARLGELIHWLVRTKRWEAARDFELTPEVVLTVAARASVLLLGLDRSVYRHVRAVIVHQRTITRRGPRATSMRGVIADGPLRVLGHALDRRGPVVLSWEAVRRDLRGSHAGNDVVAHEFAHKIDAADGLFDGTPEMTRGPHRAEWIRICTTEYRRLRRHTRRGDVDPVLGSYAAQNPGEFFAVATERFLTKPVALEGRHPALYRVLAGYYGQDPAARERRAIGVSAGGAG